jgi:hypothetical protein
MRSAYDEIASCVQKRGYALEKIILLMLEAEMAEQSAKKLRYRLSRSGSIVPLSSLLSPKAFPVPID